MSSGNFLQNAVLEGRGAVNFNAQPWIAIVWLETWSQWRDSFEVRPPRAWLVPTLTGRSVWESEAPIRWLLHVGGRCLERTSHSFDFTFVADYTFNQWDTWTQSDETPISEPKEMNVSRVVEDAFSLLLSSATHLIDAGRFLWLLVESYR